MSGTTGSLFASVSLEERRRKKEPEEQRNGEAGIRKGKNQKAKVKTENIRRETENGRCEG
jgi:hypothetical protein